MPNDSNDELTKEEKDILYDFVKDTTMFETNRKSVRYFLSIHHPGFYDRADIERMLSKLERKGYLSESIDTGDLAYGIKDSSVYKNLYKTFKIRLYFDKFKKFLKEFWTFLWKHFIITILVALITAYLYNRFILPP